MVNVLLNLNVLLQTTKISLHRPVLMYVGKILSPNQMQKSKLQAA